LKGIDVILGMD
jgi:hypothetical protein